MLQCLSGGMVPYYNHNPRTEISFQDTQDCLYTQDANVKAKQNAKCWNTMLFDGKHIYTSSQGVFSWEETVHAIT